jgi:RNA polymerase sigma-70 factor (ECF subfamily)
MEQFPAPAMETDEALSSADQPPSSPAQDARAARLRMLEILRHSYDPRSWRMFWETTAGGREPADVAEEMDVSRWAVYKARGRILQRLRDELDGLDAVD